MSKGDLLQLSQLLADAGLFREPDLRGVGDGRRSSERVDEFPHLEREAPLHTFMLTQVVLSLVILVSNALM